jgi:hypothetical protein
LANFPVRGVGIAVPNDNILVIVGNQNGGAELLMLDIQDFANPKQVKAMDIAINDLPMVSVQVIKPYLILANGSGGVEVLVYDR